jgi:F-box/leucine-rich repeat protein 10/11
LKVNDENGRIRIRIRIHWSEVWIRGSGSTPKCHGSGTLLKAFENWTFSGKQGDVFFGDMVEKCGRMVLNPGNTFFIPSGWIHAVYTPVDSLVFGGNYLHPFGIERQIKISILEETLKVPHKFRFPFFAEMMWYLLDKYCYALLGR